MEEEDEEGLAGNEGGQLKVDGGESKELVVGEQAEKQEFLGIKLRKGILLGRRGGALTPVPTWKMELSDDEKGGSKIYCGDNGKGLTVSARKLGANLWELQKIMPPPPSDSGRKMKKVVRKVGRSKEKGLDFPSHLADASHSPTHDQRPSNGSLTRKVAASLIEHQKLINGNDRALQPVSPASYVSSMEGGAYNQATTPSSSLDIKSRRGELGCNLKTSTELLKVLNRIWILEEQQTSNASIIKTLKLERDHARAQVHELIQVQQEDRQEIDELMKQYAEDKLMRKNREHERIKAAVQSIREELDNERRLRRRSESLHRKLVREVADMKLALSKAVNELDKERKARLVLEDLCDEFAKGIGDYEQEVRNLKEKHEKEPAERDDRFILHIAEAWLDERVQMKLADANHDSDEKSMMVDRLNFEIETFLRNKQSQDSKVINYLHTALKDDWIRRRSLESVPLNEATSAPQYAGDEDSIASDLHCFNKNGEDAANDDKKNSRGSNAADDLEVANKPNYIKPNVVSRHSISHRNSSSFQLQFKEKISGCRSGSRAPLADRTSTAHTSNLDEDEADKSDQIEISVCQNPENFDVQDGCQDRKSIRHIIHSSNHVTDKPVRGQSLHSNGCRVWSEIDHNEESYSWNVHSIVGSKDKIVGGVHEIESPVQKWGYHQRSPELDFSERSVKLPSGVKENTLKAKLLEARLEGQQARLRTSRG
ncbi:Uncharacterized protein EJ110_NYTH10764 [Nymphaea thermarum]|nr:Uncharacterized protein EJ110_NYTH10764 [Nymphaea thermarum]